MNTPPPRPPKTSTAPRRERNSPKRGARNAGGSTPCFRNTHGAQARAPSLATGAKIDPPAGRFVRQGRIESGPVGPQSRTRIPHVKTQYFGTRPFRPHFYHVLSRGRFLRENRGKISFCGQVWRKGHGAAARASFSMGAKTRKRPQRGVTFQILAAKSHFDTLFARLWRPTLTGRRREHRFRQK